MKTDLYDSPTLPFSTRFRGYPLKSNHAKGILPRLILQLTTTDVISHFCKNGGNDLGMEEADGWLIRKLYPVPTQFVPSSLPIRNC